MFLATFRTTQPDEATLAVRLALFLFDGFTGENRLAGVYDDPAREDADERQAMRDGDRTRLDAHTTVRLATRPGVPFRKPGEATFVLFDLAAGPYTARVRSPYYVARDIAVAAPATDPRWPAFPNVMLADERLPLDSPDQPPAYRTQRLAATLQPSVRYLFPPTATLVRGTVRTGTQSLEGARVRRLPPAVPPPVPPPASAPGAIDWDYVTEPDGEYVLFFSDIKGTFSDAGGASAGESITLEVTHPLHAAVQQVVSAVRGQTVRMDVVMA
jgi:hypothetical protein